MRNTINLTTNETFASRLLVEKDFCLVNDSDKNHVQLSRFLSNDICEDRGNSSTKMKKNDTSFLNTDLNTASSNNGSLEAVSRNSSNFKAILTSLPSLDCL